MKRICLYGPHGSGKSTVGKVLAKKLDLSFVDLDIIIEQKAGMPISQIMARLGEPAFRDKESAALQDVLDGEGQIVALGGGAFLLAENRALAEAAGRGFCLPPNMESVA